MADKTRSVATQLQSRRTGAVAVAHFRSRIFQGLQVCSSDGLSSASAAATGRVHPVRRRNAFGFLAAKQIAARSNRRWVGFVSDPGGCAFLSCNAVAAPNE